MNRFAALTLLMLAVLLLACSSVKYGDATAQETVNTDFGSTDLQGIAGKMLEAKQFAGKIDGILLGHILF